MLRTGDNENQAGAGRRTLARIYGALAAVLVVAAFGAVALDESGTAWAAEPSTTSGTQGGAAGARDEALAGALSRFDFARGPGVAFTQLTPEPLRATTPLEGFARLKLLWRAFFVHREFVGDAKAKEEALSKAWWDFDMEAVYKNLDGKWKSGRQQVFVGRLEEDKRGRDVFRFRLPKEGETINVKSWGEARIATRYLLSPNEIEGNKVYRAWLGVDFFAGHYDAKNITELWPTLFGYLAHEQPRQSDTAREKALAKAPTLTGSEAAKDWLAYINEKMPETTSFVLGFFQLESLGDFPREVPARSAALLNDKAGAPYEVAQIDIRVRRNMPWIEKNYRSLAGALERASRERLARMTSEFYTPKGNLFAAFDFDSSDTIYEFRALLTRDGVLPRDREGRVAEGPFQPIACGTKFTQVVSGTSNTSGVTVSLKNMRLNWEVACAKDKLNIELRLARAPELDVQGQETLRFFVNLIIPGSLEEYAEMFFKMLAGYDGMFQPLTIRMTMLNPGPNAVAQVEGYVPIIANKFMSFMFSGVGRAMGPRRMTNARRDFLRAQERFLTAVERDALAAMGEAKTATPTVRPASQPVAPTATTTQAPTTTP